MSEKKNQDDGTKEALHGEIAELRARLEEAEQTIEAIRMFSYMFWLSEHEAPSVPMPTFTLASSMPRMPASRTASRRPPTPKNR